MLAVGLPHVPLPGSLFLLFSRPRIFRLLAQRLHLEHSWLLMLDPVLMKPLEFCSEPRINGHPSALYPFFGSRCLCSNT